jgi:GDP-mannose 6-dehydrogenase
MRIAVLGMGYVGCVSAACLADLGHEVVGVDVDSRKLDMIRRGHPPIIESGLDELLARVVECGALTVSDSAASAVASAELTMVCVGTPSRPNGSLDTSHLDRVVEEIGAALVRERSYRVIAIRSTLLPGVLDARIVPQLQAASGGTVDSDFGICVNPEFLRESTAINDFRTPPFTLIGQRDQRAGDLLAQAYAGIDAPIHRVSPDAAAMVKYASNAYHALKVTFANEIGAICRSLDVDSRRVMEIFCQDRQLNVSAAYLRPGFAFGGSCLPKDVRALLYAARQRDVDVPVLGAMLPSNDMHIKRVVDLVSHNGRRRIAMLGLSFKPGTDDLRESPLVRLAETLVGKGHLLQIYDEDVALSNLVGRNRAYIEQVLPHLGELMSTDLGGLVTAADVIIVGKRFPRLDDVRHGLRAEQMVVDLTRSGEWHGASVAAIV